MKEDIWMPGANESLRSGCYMNIQTKEIVDEQNGAKFRCFGKTSFRSVSRSLTIVNAILLFQHSCFYFSSKREGFLIFSFSTERMALYKYVMQLTALELL